MVRLIGPSSIVALPQHLGETDPAQSLERERAAIDELIGLVREELRDRIGDKDLAGLGAAADPERDLDGGTEQPPLRGDGLTG